MRFYISMAAGAVLTLLAAELVFQLLPVSSGARMEATSDAAPYARYLPQQSMSYSYGWALGNAHRSKVNQQGFNNSPDLQDHAKVLVIGDSFIESLMLDQSQTVQGYLGASLHGGVYAASASANGLADSLQIARFFVPRIHPRNVVLFVEPTDVSGILSAPLHGHSAFSMSGDGVTVRHNPYRESSAKMWALHSALLRYTYYNLKLPEWFSGKFHGGQAQPPMDHDSYAQKRQAALQYYLEQLRLLGGEYGVRFVFLVDGDRKAMYANNRRGENTWQGDDRTAFLAMVRQYGFDVADMQPVFERDWALRRERLDFLPMDGHWNAVAHRLAARQLLPMLADSVR
ncbi:hypothetical protein GTP81_13095 [Rugamonas sp. FT107W]|uniref:AlgX/AlgJ SGNH hydrolase-like domain-containing protein n=1 Tax=Duganella vulcania TaxID=2692166 RepID=A0A845HEK9_9BURK|nr:hypothetical protein [Duganella vulcania]MYN17692.1 hypothetical protein [Duganella vulcania]